jgi:hypothetical protein
MEHAGPVARDLIGKIMTVSQVLEKASYRSIPQEDVYYPCCWQVATLI